MSGDGYRGYIPLTTGMEDEGDTIRMDDRGRARLVSFDQEPDRDGDDGIPHASLTGPSAVAHQRLIEAATEARARRQHTPPPPKEPAPWLTRYMVDQGLVEDPRFASAFETGGPDVAVRDALERDQPLPSFDDKEDRYGR